MRCGNISYSNWSLLLTIFFIKMRLFCICVLRGEHVSDFLFRIFPSLPGGMDASIVLLNEQDSLSCVLTPYSFIFICIWHMIGKIGEKWQTAMMWLKRQYTDQRM